MASSVMHSNVHLLLSSFAVMTPSFRLLNISLYVQCGADAKINICCKSSSSTRDLRYKNISNFQQNDPTATISKAYVLGKKSNVAINNNTVFKVRTEGGAEYLQTVDICLDHKLGHSKNLVQSLVECLQDTSLIPTQVDQLITANSVILNEEARICANEITQVDPVRAKGHVNSRKNALRLKDLQILERKFIKYVSLSLDNPEESTLKFTQARNSPRNLLELAIQNNILILKNPLFGSDYNIVLLTEKKLGGYAKDLQARVEQKNKRSKSNYLTAQINTMFLSEGLYDSDDLYPLPEDFITMVENLFLFIRAQSQESISERLFNSKNFYLKMSILKIINNSHQIYLQLKSDDVINLQNTLVLLKDLRFNLELLQATDPHSALLSTIVAKVEEAQNYPSQKGFEISI